MSWADDASDGELPPPPKTTSAEEGAGVPPTGTACPSSYAAAAAAADTSSSITIVTTTSVTVSFVEVHHHHHHVVDKKQPTPPAASRRPKTVLFGGRAGAAAAADFIALQGKKPLFTGAPPGSSKRSGVPSPPEGTGEFAFIKALSAACHHEASTAGSRSSRTPKRDEAAPVTTTECKRCGSVKAGKRFQVTADHIKRICSVKEPDQSGLILEEGPYCFECVNSLAPTCFNNKTTGCTGKRGISKPGDKHTFHLYCPTCIAAHYAALEK